MAAIVPGQPTPATTTAAAVAAGTAPGRGTTAVLRDLHDRHADG
ncbi:hypothetical protein [Streptomyces sp. NPDC048527]